MICLVAVLGQLGSSAAFAESMTVLVDRKAREARLYQSDLCVPFQAGLEEAPCIRETESAIGPAYQFGRFSIAAYGGAFDPHETPRLTVTAWINVPSQSGATGYLFSTGGGGGFPHLGLYKGELMARAGRATFRTPREIEAMPRDEWVFVAGVWDYEARTFRWHVNDEFETFANLATRLSGETVDVRPRYPQFTAPGSDGADGFVFLGGDNFESLANGLGDVAVSDIRLFHEALNIDEIESLRAVHEAGIKEVLPPLLLILPEEPDVVVAMAEAPEEESDADANVMMASGAASDEIVAEPQVTEAEVADAAVSDGASDAGTDGEATDAPEEPGGQVEPADDAPVTAMVGLPEIDLSEAKMEPSENESVPSQVSAAPETQRVPEAQDDPLSRDEEADEVAAPETSEIDTPSAEPAVEEEEVVADVPPETEVELANLPREKPAVPPAPAALDLGMMAAPEVKMPVPTGPVRYSSVAGRVGIGQETLTLDKAFLSGIAWDVSEGAACAIGLLARGGGEGPATVQRCQSGLSLRAEDFKSSLDIDLGNLGAARMQVCETATGAVGGVQLWGSAIDAQGALFYQSQGAQEATDQCVRWSPSVLCPVDQIATGLVVHFAAPGEDGLAAVSGLQLVCREVTVATD